MPNDIAREVEKIAEDLGVDRKRSIGEVAKELKIKTHVIRFWEENFSQVKPEIGSGKRRYYYNKQLKILKRIKKFLYEEGYTIAGLQKLLSKRKNDDDREEDLDVILVETPKEREIEIDDFIDPTVKVINSNTEDLRTKFMDFANVKIPEINPMIRKDIEKSLSRARKNLKDLRALVKI